jgi:hypothetical protein
LTTKTLFFQFSVETGFWSAENQSFSKRARTASLDAEWVRVLQVAINAPAVAATAATPAANKN